jgi:predicted DNA binding protein
MGVNQSTAGDGTATSLSEDRELRVVMEISRGGPCVMDEVEEKVVDIDVRFGKKRCNVDATVRNTENDGLGTKYFSNNLCSHCPGKVFSNHGCIPRYLQIDDGSFVMETFVSDGETVSEIVSDVREICERVSVRTIVSADDSQCEEVRTIDVTEMTQKQREAVVKAQAAGYYDPNSSITLGEIAGELGISTSALSQRLKRAEANVIQQVECE